MTTLPDDFQCPRRPGGPLPKQMQFTDVHTQCPAYLGKFITTSEGIVKCERCGNEVGVETDLDAGMLVEDGAGADDDDDGNMDNPEFNNVETVLEGELVNETPEETMRREVTAVIYDLAQELKEHAKPTPTDVEDNEEREHNELINNRAMYYAAYLSTNADDIAATFMHFSRHGINAFGGERIANRRAALLAVFLYYRMERGFIFSEEDMVRLLAQNYSQVDAFRRMLIRAKLGEDQNETGYYVNLYARALKFNEEKVKTITEEWDRDIEPFIPLQPPIVAMGFVLSAAEQLLGEKVSTAQASRKSGWTRDSISKARKRFDKHFRTLKSTS